MSPCAFHAYRRVPPSNATLHFKLFTRRRQLRSPPARDILFHDFRTRIVPDHCQILLLTGVESDQILLSKKLIKSVNQNFLRLIRIKKKKERKVRDKSTRVKSERAFFSTKNGNDDVGIKSLSIYLSIYRTEQGFLFISRKRR